MLQSSGITPPRPLHGTDQDFPGALPKVDTEGTGWSIKRIVRALRPLQHVTIRIAGGQQLHAEPTIPNDVAAMLTRLGH